MILVRHMIMLSVMDGVPFPKSLINIFKELRDDVGFEIPMSGIWKNGLSRDFITKEL
jgi:uracil DNA glycosylase